MRSLLYLLTLTVSCFLKNVNCVNKNVEKFKSNKEAMDLVAKYHNHQINTQKDLNEKLKEIKINIAERTLNNYLNEITEDGCGSRYISFDRFISNEKAMSLVGKYYDQKNKEISSQKKLLKKLEDEIGLIISETALNEYLKKIKEDGCGSRYISFDRFISNEKAMSLVGQYNNKQNEEIDTQLKLLEKLKNIGVDMGKNTLTKYLKTIAKAKETMEEEAKKSLAEARQRLYERQCAETIQSVPGFDATAYFPNQSQSMGWTGPGTFVPSQAGTDSTNFFGGNLQNNDGTLESIIRTGKPGSSKNASQGFNTTPFLPNQSQLSSITGSAPHYGDAMPYHQVPPMDDTFVPFQAGTDSTNFFGWNSQNNDGDLESMIRPKNMSSWKGFDGTPFLPNQLQSTGLAGVSNFFSPTPQSSNFNSSNPGSAAYYGDAIPFQQAPPMPGTSSFPNYPYNQSAQLNSSTNFGPFQPGTPSLDWSGGNSQNNEGDLYSVVRPKKPRN